MQLRSGRLLAPLPAPLQQGARCPCCPKDRISSLPDDVLLFVLARLRSAREAARTGVLSRRWLDLWKQLPELSFSGVDVDLLEGALACVTRPTLDLLDIHLAAELESGCLSSLLRTAAKLSPECLIITLSTCTSRLQDEELPCLYRTTSLQLTAVDLRIAPLVSGEFTVLKSLSLHSCYVDLYALLPICPCLCALKISGLNFNDCVGSTYVTIHSSSLEELTVESSDSCSGFGVIDIMAPVLKKVEVTVGRVYKLRGLLLAPLVEELFWWHGYDLDDITFSEVFMAAIGLTWRLGGIGIRFGQEEPRHVKILEMNICCTEAWLLGAEEGYSITQAIERLPVADFSDLELNIWAEGHAIGPLVLHLLQILPAIQRLKLDLDSYQSKEYACPVNCPCGQPESWRNCDISLMGLEVVEISGFDGKDHEVDLLKFIFRCAPKLETISVAFNEGSLDEKIEEICNISFAYPHVDYSVYSTMPPKINEMQEQ
ncbi:unnamed protein product [Urochloa decumbens]|uniref:FBD domain-containing protein n=1 Tax=Urochloa decumbens TaxID=240449 RepID=A0ABC9D1T2_9POAL